jgi:Mg2+-importing ATPase
MQDQKATNGSTHNHGRHTNGNSNGFARKRQAWDFDYISAPHEVVLRKFRVTDKGLSEQEAHLRLEEYGPNEPAMKKRLGIVRQILLKFLNPLVVVLLIIALVSIFFGELVNAFIVGLMAAVSVILSFVQEYRAERAAERLGEMVRTTTTVWRNGKQREINIREVVPGDIIDLFAGDMIPADIRIFSCKDFFINQSSLTGESFPIEKFPTPPTVPSPSPTEQTNIAFMGSSVVSGTALAIAVKTGSETQFGELYQKLSTISVTTAFDKGLRQFTMLMVKAMLCLVLCIFAIVSFREANYLEAFLFSLGVAVGLTPEMLPMIVAFTLSQGALQLAKKKAIVKRLNSIQNFGAMDVLCTDKTGTLTLDKIVLEKHCDVQGQEDEEVLRYAYINSFYQTGLRNLLDKAILRHEKLLMRQYEKVDEVPFDFSRKIMSVVVTMDGCHTLIAKGAPREIYKRISHYDLHGKLYEIDPKIVADLMEEYYSLSAEGFRVLAVAYKKIPDPKGVYSKEDEKDLILKGYVAFLDPPKPGAKAAIDALKKFGVDLKVLTGDNELVTKKICQEVGLSFHTVFNGDDVEKASDEDLKRLVEEGNVFARLSPLQKERVVRTLHNNGHIVGYLGDGINDAPALKTSDVGISVNNATDIAKESADIILLKKSLMILRDGVTVGRKTFGNIVKYIKMGASSNFGNMLSMTAASIFLPFLPMLPIQILLNNLLYDFSQIAIPTDHVDPEYVSRPRPWNVSYIKKFMLLIGPISSIFDFVTFWVLLVLFQADPVLFHTGWFLESLCTQTLVIHVIRTRRIPFVESWPSPFLFVSSVLIVTMGFIIPQSSLGPFFGFVPPPTSYYGALFIISSAYFLSVQMVKMWFVRRFGLV